MITQTLAEYIAGTPDRALPQEVEHKSALHLLDTVAAINALRTAEQGPIDVMQRIFTEPPFVVPGLEPLSIDKMQQAVADAKAAGFREIIIDTAFTTEVHAPADWVAFPRRLAAVLDAAR